MKKIIKCIIKLFLLLLKGSESVTIFIKLLFWHKETDNYLAVSEKLDT